MAIRNLLVGYNGTEGADSALGLGLLMAQKYDAHLTGILAHGPVRGAEHLAPWLSACVVEYIAERERELAESIAGQFRERVAGAGREGKADFIDASGDPDTRLAACASCHDFLLLGRFDPAQGRENLAMHPDRVALQSGRPLIVVPPGYRTESLPDHALVAWDGKRAAARALNDAMLILETKAKVTVLTVGSAPGREPRPGEDPMVHLARHGVPAERVHLEPGGRTIGRTILESCEENDVGLLVMGAYEHSKFSEDLVGGVTNEEVLRRARIPALMAH